MNTSVEDYFNSGCGRCPLGNTPECKVHQWSKELTLLRSIILSTGIEETCKWGNPCYTVNDKNVLMLSCFKDYCSVSFFKGALIKDEAKLLVKPGPNSHISRLFKFKSVAEIEAIKDHVKAYIFESIEIERAGLEVNIETKSEPIPTELAEQFQIDPVFKAAFENLTPGRQRGYLLHFNQAKQSATRTKRIEKCMPMILSGIGLHDKYQSRKQK